MDRPDAAYHGHPLSPEHMEWLEELWLFGFRDLCYSHEINGGIDHDDHQGVADSQQA